MSKKQRDYSSKITKFHNLGILRRGEEINAVEKVNFEGKIHFADGLFFITNQRLIVTDLKVTSALYTWDLDQIISVNTVIGGAIERRVTRSILSIKYENEIRQINLFLDYGETFFNTIIQNKKKYSKIQSIKIDKLIIEEGKNEDAIKILQKRLARGEITKEEFYDLVRFL